MTIKIWSEFAYVDEAMFDEKLNADVGADVPRYKNPDPRGLQANWKVNAPETVTVWAAYMNTTGTDCIVIGVLIKSGTIENADEDGVGVVDEVEVEVTVELAVLLEDGVTAIALQIKE